jgi:DNA-binding NtrC family response regulator
MLQRYATTDEPVLITGEIGTGKELADRAIHENSRRHAGLFIAM